MLSQTLYSTEHRHSILLTDKHKMIESNNSAMFAKYLSKKYQQMIPTQGSTLRSQIIVFSLFSPFVSFFLVPFIFFSFFLFFLFSFPFFPNADQTSLIQVFKIPSAQDIVPDVKNRCKSCERDGRIHYNSVLLRDTGDRTLEHSA